MICSPGLIFAPPERMMLSGERIMANRATCFYFAAVTFVAFVFVIFIGYVLYQAFEVGTGNFASVATLILVGLAAFIGIMNILSFTAHFMGIIDPRQPFGLPEGTVRAILTISFIILVGVLASFMLTQTGREPFSDKRYTIREGLAPDVAEKLAQQYSADGLVVLVPNADKKSVDVEFRARRDYRLADDIAKQILTILSTILAAMIGFYFGARPAEATAANPDAAERKRILTELDTLAAQAPTAAAIRQTAEKRLKANENDAAKKAKIQEILDKLTTAEKSLAAARKDIGDDSQPIEKARDARAKVKAAIEDFGALNKQLEAIPPP
jgi:hypothetical protein